MFYTNLYKLNHLLKLIKFFNMKIKIINLFFLQHLRKNTIIV